MIYIFQHKFTLLTPSKNTSCEIFGPSTQPGKLLEKCLEKCGTPSLKNMFGPFLMKNYTILENKGAHF